MKIPCDTIVRLMGVVASANSEFDPIFQTLRLDNGKIIATDRRFMAVEKTESFDGVYNIRIDDALLEQCRTEAKFSSWLEIIITPALQFITAKTTLGYIAPDNIGVFPGKTDFDRWSDIPAKCCEPAEAPNGGMVWLVDDVLRLAKSSPSGTVLFEKVIDCQRPTVLRDPTTPDWCGFFIPSDEKNHGQVGASLPKWLVA